MSWDFSRASRLALLFVGAALVACRYGWAAVALVALSVVLHAVDSLVSRAKHEERLAKAEMALAELQAAQKRQALVLEALGVANRKPGF